MNTQWRQAAISAGSPYLPHTVGLLVGRGRPGTYFGYDRRPQMGPWLVRAVVRRLHRHTRYLDLADVDLDWEHHVARAEPSAARPPEPI